VIELTLSIESSESLFSENRHQVRKFKYIWTSELTVLIELSPLQFCALDLKLRIGVVVDIHLSPIGVAHGEVWQFMLDIIASSSWENRLLALLLEWSRREGASVWPLADGVGGTTFYGCGTYLNESESSPPGP
jgi:hypothetical protein